MSIIPFNPITVSFLPENSRYWSSSKQKLPTISGIPVVNFQFFEKYLLEVKPVSQSYAEAFDTFASEWIKRKSELFHCLDFFQFRQSMQTGVTKKDLRLFIKQLYQEEGEPSVLDRVIKTFIRQKETEDVFEYCRDFFQMRAECLRFLLEIGDPVPLVSMIANSILPFVQDPKLEKAANDTEKFLRSFDDLRLQEQLLTLAIEIEQCRHLGLTVSHWNPKKPISVLMRTLALHGPHLVKGYYCASIDARKEDTVFVPAINRHVLDWSRSKGELMTIIVVGASQNEDVYYIEPSQSPYDPENIKQPIYRISYGDFCANVVNLLGLKGVPFTPSNPLFMFALHLDHL